MSGDERPAYEVRLRSRRVQRELDSLREPDYRRIVAKIRALAHKARPVGWEKLDESIYRVRVGDYRIVYLVDEENRRIEVGAVGRRSERAYQGFEGLFR